MSDKKPTNRLSREAEFKIASWLLERQGQHTRTRPSYADIAAEVSGNVVTCVVTENNIRGIHNDLKLEWTPRRCYTNFRSNDLNRELSGFIVDHIVPLIDMKLNEVPPLIRAAAEDRVREQNGEAKK